MELVSIDMPVLVMLMLLRLIAGARFGGSGRGPWPPRDRESS